MSASQVDNSQLEVLLINNQSSPVLVPSLAFPNPTGYPSSNLVTDISLVNCGRQTGRWYKLSCGMDADAKLSCGLDADTKLSCGMDADANLFVKSIRKQKAIKHSSKACSYCVFSLTQQLTTQYTSVSNPFYWYKVWSQGFKWTVNCNNRSLFLYIFIANHAVVIQ